MIGLQQGAGAAFTWAFKEQLRKDFPGGSDGKASPYNAGDPGLIPRIGEIL